MTAPDPACPAGVHGDLYAYRRHGCRCPEARRARSLDAARYRRARGAQPAPETVRAGRYAAMLRQLLKGHTYDDLADRLGWAKSRLSAILHAERIQGPTAERIEELHSLLVLGRPLARRRWAPFDPEVVERAAAGMVPWSDLNAEHRQAVAAKLRGEGLRLEEAAARLRVSEQVVKRWSARDRASQVA
ncbi:helix-turn-helix transcriptional regulator [Micromonospora sp. NPDC006766]|uniref:helix-turn-helix domain-containing protein n=1 Tax=Micromonospora sp. NPDC006766 TaxID=3154778 RepID=UPI0033C51C78